MPKHQRGYISWLLATLIVFGFLLTGGLLRMTKTQPGDGGKTFAPKDASQSADRTLQVKTVDFAECQHDGDADADCEKPGEK